MDKTFEGVLAEKYLPKRKPHFSKLGGYEETPVFVLVDMAEDVDNSVVQKCLGGAEPSGTDLEDL